MNLADQLNAINPEEAARAIAYRDVQIRLVTLQRLREMAIHGRADKKRDLEKRWAPLSREGPPALGQP